MYNLHYIIRQKRTATCFYGVKFNQYFSLRTARLITKIRIKWPLLIASWSIRTAKSCRLKYEKYIVSYAIHRPVGCFRSRGTMFKKGVKSLMRMGKQRNSPDKEALVDSDDSAQMATVAYQRGHATETSDLSSDNESIHSHNAEYSPKPKK